VFGAFHADIKIRGAGGSAAETSHFVSLDNQSEENAHSQRPQNFTEHKQLKAPRMMKVPETARFGIELELSSAMQLQAETVAPYLQDTDIEVHVIRDYRQGRSTSDQWKLVPDGSIVCSASQPDCNKFELVSPPLCAGKGLHHVSRILNRMENIQPRLKVNKSMGFHVHVDVSSFTTSQLIKVCQQFVKYEEVLDTFMPSSRRTGSTESNSYFQSNRGSVEDQIFYGGAVSNRQIHNALEECHDVPSLVNMMNRQGRYYKLNMQNLATGRQPTIEFRQHSATMNYEKVSAWIRFCIAFCMNSARLKAPTPFTDRSSLEKKFEGLFQFVIKDRALREFYRNRRDALASGDDDDCACCTTCAVGRSGGRGCASKLY